MNIGIIGAGHAGIALAALLVEQGRHDVRLYSDPNHASRLKAIDQNASCVTLRNLPRGTESVVELDASKRVPSLEAVVGFADVIYNTTPIQAHDDIFRSVRAAANTLERRLTYVNLGGGFSIFAHLLASVGQPDNINLATLHTLPYASRVSGTEVRVVKFRKATSIAFSHEVDDRQVDLLEQLSGETIVVDVDLLHLSLDRSSYVMNPVITLFNINKIDKGENFNFYRDGFSDAIKSLIIGADTERHTLARKLGYTDYPAPTDRLEEFLQTCRQAFSDIKPPASANHRYILEDLPYGLVPIIDLGWAAGVDMPLCSSLVDIAGTIVRQNLWDSPYRLKNNLPLLTAFTQSRAA